MTLRRKASSFSHLQSYTCLAASRAAHMPLQHERSPQSHTRERYRGQTVHLTGVKQQAVLRYNQFLTQALGDD